MSVHDERQYPWLVEEKKAIGTVIQSSKKVLGVCLGAQLIATALGAEVKPNREKEIGWFPINKLKISSNKWNQVLPDAILAFHWHGETFAIPDGAEAIYSSEACQNQGFIFGENVIALQFHLETTETLAQSLIEQCGDELVDSQYIQTKEQMLNPDHFVHINNVMKSIIQTLIQ
ncbi:type 1 glutamine amidotransferase [Teredinibacter sp. KSP-S5-2]|uniref:type 1 glutamine amidotransferase n=1 Tax=Teredinibacter sp. KSP-S5-2 TaxID=3034506 RepID=UPI00397757D5